MRSPAPGAEAQRASEPRGGEEAGLGAVHPEVPGPSAPAFVGGSLAPWPSPGGEKERLDWMSREVPTRRRCGGGDVRICRLAFHTELAARPGSPFCVLWPEEGSAELPEGFTVGPFGRPKMSSEPRLLEAFLFVESPGLPASL